MGKIIKPTLDDIARYASFEPKPSMIGAGKRGAVVADEASGLAGRLKPRLQERFYPSGRLYTVEFALENPVPFSDVSDRLSNSYNTLRGRWQEFKQQHPYIAGAVKAGITAGTAGGLMLLASCGGGNGTPEPEGDTTPPAEITDLSASANDNYPESVGLGWTSPGDDGMSGSPDWFLIRYVKCPDQNDCKIQNQEDWENATDLASVSAEDGSAGTHYSRELDVPPGNLCFAVRTYDDADNISGLSNSPCAQVISKAEDFVDHWTENMINLYLFYPEVVAMVQGDSNAGIDSKALALATEMINATNQPPDATIEDHKNYLLSLSDGVIDFDNDNYEFNNATPENPAWLWDADDLGDPGVALYIVTPTNPDGTGVDNYDNIPMENMNNIKDIMLDTLIKYVDTYPAKYGNLEEPYCDPGWSRPSDRTCDNSFD